VAPASSTFSQWHSHGTAKTSRCGHLQSVHRVPLHVIPVPLIRQFEISRVPFGTQYFVFNIQGGTSQLNILTVAFSWYRGFMRTSRCGHLQSIHRVPVHVIPVPLVMSKYFRVYVRKLSVSMFKEGAEGISYRAALTSPFVPAAFRLAGDLRASCSEQSA
jgi:hypothetical protein